MEKTIAKVDKWLSDVRLPAPAKVSFERYRKLFFACYTAFYLRSEHGKNVMERLEALRKIHGDKYLENGGAQIYSETPMAKFVEEGSRRKQKVVIKYRNYEDLHTISQRIQNEGKHALSIAKANKIFALVPLCSPYRDISKPIELVDYLRSSTGSIIYPFRMWQQCLSAYDLKNKHYSNLNLAKKIFQKREVYTDRYYHFLAAKTLNLASILIKSAADHTFPLHHPKLFPTPEYFEYLRNLRITKEDNLMVYSESEGWIQVTDETKSISLPPHRL